MNSKGVQTLAEWMLRTTCLRDISVGFVLVPDSVVVKAWTSLGLVLRHVLRKWLDFHALWSWTVASFRLSSGQGNPP